LASGFLVEEAAQVVRAVEKDLGLADTAEQVVVFGPDRVIAQLARGSDQRAPGLLQEAAGRRGLGDGHAQLGQQLGRGRRVVQRGQQAIDLGAGGFLVQCGAVRAGGCKGEAHRSVILVSLSAE
jgi:hypothetical protein